jgi:hypothetical protein
VSDEDWVFDEDFVRGAKKQEGTAEERADKAAQVRAGHERMAEQGMIRGPQPTARPKTSWNQRTLGIPRWLIAGMTLLLVAGMVGLVVAQVL